MIKKSLKRAFKLSNKNDKNFISKLDNAESEYKINVILLNAAKEGMKSALKQRDGILQDLLLSKYGYILSANDQLVYMSQTKELMVYDLATINIENDSDNYGQEY